MGREAARYVRFASAAYGVVMLKVRGRVPCAAWNVGVIQVWFPLCMSGVFFYGGGERGEGSGILHGRGELLLLRATLAPLLTLFLQVL